MPDDDQRDPLGAWLGQEVRPLPPPPGTFELITRRARRRKLRKLAISVGSAAAVVVAAAIAAPPLLSLHVTPSQEQAGGVAAGGPASGGTNRAQQPNGTATRDTMSPPISPGPVSRPTAPVPPNFRPVSVTFVSTSTGWVIGQAGTPGTCANANRDICTSIARTDDAGKTWHGGAAPGTTGPDGARGVSGIRFLDGTSGWAFGPELWVTHDTGRTWAQVNTNGQRVTDLETAGDRAFALWGRCSGTGSTAFAADCASYTLMTATAGSDTWTPVGSATSGLSHGGLATSAVVALTDTTGYLLAPDGTMYSGPLGGAWQKAGLTGCLPGAAQENGLPAGALLAPVNSTTVVIACGVNGGVQVSTSPDGGAAWAAQPVSAWSAVSRPPAATSLAASPDGTLALATGTGIDVLPAGAPQWRQASIRDAPAGGFTYVGLTTNDQGVALPADASLHEIWMTFDGGKTWAPAAAITPGS